MTFQAAVVLLLLAVWVLGGCAPAGDAQPLLAADFETDPAPAGWQLAAPEGADADGEWHAGAAKAAGCLVVRQGYWQSPAVPVVPFAYYRVRFRSKAPANAYWSAAFFDADGAELAADAYDRLHASKAWQEGGACFRGQAGASTVRVRFQSLGHPVWVDDVVVEAVGPEAVAAWADEVYAALPPLEFAPEPDRWRLLPDTLARLRRGGTLRVVVLGDSIANDTSNSLFEVLLGRAYPEARIEVVTSVRGGTGCEYYQDAGRVEEYALRFEPDLLVIAGISHGYDAEAIRRVVRQVRAAAACEILVLSGAVCSRERMQESFLKRSRLPEAAAREYIGTWPDRLARMAEQEKVELFDLRAAWDDYVAASPRPLEWYQRDEVHANTRGKQVLARLLLAYFAPRASRRV